MEVHPRKKIRFIFYIPLFVRTITYFKFVSSSKQKQRNYLLDDRLYSKYDDNNSDPTYDVNRVSR